MYIYIYLPLGLGILERVLGDVEKVWEIAKERREIDIFLTPSMSMACVWDTYYWILL